MNTHTGFLKVKNETIKVSDKFSKREFVLADDAVKYPQTILFQLTQDRCSLIDNVNIGDEVTVHFSLKGREWKNPQGEIKVFNSLDVFKIETVNKAKKTSMAEIISMQGNSVTLVPEDNSDLPF